MIDVHTHLWPESVWPVYLKDYFNSRKKAGEDIDLTGAALLRHMEQSGVKKSVVSSLSAGRNCNY